MPKTWYDRRANSKSSDMNDAERELCDFNIRILADKKPYFMRYIYPTLMKQYNGYTVNTEAKCLQMFRKTIGELTDTPEHDLTDDQKAFLGYYKSRMPVSTLDCVGNRVCRMIESEFDGILRFTPGGAFDKDLLKSGCEYSKMQYDAIRRLFKEYTARIKAVEAEKRKRRLTQQECDCMRENIADEFSEMCADVCSNANQLCDIMIDVCYSVEWSKSFVWEMCGEEIINNLLEKNNRMLSYPERCTDGDIMYRGERYALTELWIPEEK